MLFTHLFLLSWPQLYVIVCAQKGIWNVPQRALSFDEKKDESTTTNKIAAIKFRQVNNKW